VPAARCAPGGHERGLEISDMPSQSLQTRAPAGAQAAIADLAAIIPAMGSAASDDGLRIRAILGLPATWWQRSRFRAKLRTDLRDKPDLLRDIGIGVYEAQAEASRYFWEASILERR
jgi:uncharacterized protein YjiS (DUF1127 family)